MSQEHELTKSERRRVWIGLIISFIIGMGSLGSLIWHFGPYGHQFNTNQFDYTYPRLLQVSFNPPQYLNDWLIIQANVTNQSRMVITETDQILGRFTWTDPESFRIYNESYAVSINAYMSHLKFFFSVHTADTLLSPTLGNWSFVLGPPGALPSLTPSHMPTVAICLSGPCKLAPENQ